MFTEMEMLHASTDAPQSDCMRLVSVISSMIACWLHLVLFFANTNFEATVYSKRSEEPVICVWICAGLTKETGVFPG